MIVLFFKLICGHAIADFALQGEFIARFKSRWTPSPEVLWPYVLAAHSLIHGLMVFLATGNATVSILESVCHATIDFGKCEKWYNIHIDQWLHILCKVVWVYMAR